jgi:hypothetical protein
MLRSLLVLSVTVILTACALDSDANRAITVVESFPHKKLQSSPYEVSTWPNLRGISRQDIREIEELVLAHREIRKPILRMFASRDDRVQVITGRDEHRGDIYNCFDVLKRGRKWILASPIVDSRTTEERSELLRRAGPST